MNIDLQKLIELEKVDHEIARLQDEVAALPKRVSEIEAKLAEIRAQVERVKAGIAAQEKARRGFEDEIRSQQQKIAKYRGQSLDVKTNEQYKALMHEIEFAEQAIRGSEDKILDGMVAVESGQQTLKESEASARTQSAGVEKEKVEARERTAEDELKLAELRAQRQELRGHISEGVLSTYDRVARGRKNPLAEAREQRCSACFVLIRPQKYNELRSAEEVHTCDSCGRILFHNPANDPPPAEPAGRQRGRKNAGEEASNAETEAVSDAPSAP